MATAQSDSDKKQVGQLGEVDAGGFVHTKIGGVSFYTGQGAANHAAIKGSLYVNTSTGELYICTAATGTWVKVGTQS
tara:strand:+ start:399 stop:629 length:231 start_codon:yes stop_codon:yes gene_type:complete